MTTLISFVVGNAARRVPGLAARAGGCTALMPPLLALHALPFFLLGLILVYVFAFTLQCCRSTAATPPAAFPELDLAFALDVLDHAILPALSIILVSIGGWALGMRAMMVTTQGEDFTNFAEAKGLQRDARSSSTTAIRNAMLPQATALALVLGQSVSGAVLVEVIFGYPGIGTVLFQAIQRLRLLPGPGDRLHRDHLDRPGDADPRSRLSAARPAHHLSERLSIDAPAPRRTRPRAHAGARRRWRSAARRSSQLPAPQHVASGRPGLLLVGWSPSPSIGQLPGRPRQRPAAVGPRRSSRRPGRCRSAATGRAATSSRVVTTGTPLTLRIGLIAGFIGVGIGATLAFVSAYYGGWVDSLMRGVVDTGLTVPGLMVLIIVALIMRDGMSVNQMALVIASLAWLYPARTIRSQVLTLRERGYVQIARMSGMSGPEIIVKELCRTCCPTSWPRWSARSRRRSWPRSASRCSGSARSRRRRSG